MCGRPVNWWNTIERVGEYRQITPLTSQSMDLAIRHSGDSRAMHDRIAVHVYDYVVLSRRSEGHPIEIILENSSRVVEPTVAVSNRESMAVKLGRGWRYFICIRIYISRPFSRLCYFGLVQFSRTWSVRNMTMTHRSPLSCYHIGHNSFRSRSE